MSEAIAAVVFDLDGVLVNSESVWDAAWHEVVARNGGCWQADATRAMMGMSSPEWSRYLHDQLGVPLEPERINELVVAAVPTWAEMVAPNQTMLDAGVTLPFKMLLTKLPA
jgi:beta-phosphoglucomutase-like phosphatase (HAD superfamily)